MFVVLITLIIQVVLTQKPSPCPSLFVYEPKGSEPDRWYGRMTLTTAKTLIGISLEIELDKQALFLMNSFGETITENQRDFVIHNKNYIWEPIHESLSVRFFVKYDQALGVIPSLVGIRLNGKIVCNILEDATSNVNSTRVSVDDLYPTAPADTEQERCGSVRLESKPLITFGQSSFEGEWPWHAALYLYEGVNMIYLCGGSLITLKHVLTAAHCVTKIRSNILVKQKLMVIYLGKHNLYKQDSSVQSKEISRITVHPDYDEWNLHNDLAIILLKSVAEYTHFVRHVCLWEEDTSLNGLLDRLGTVVGWGFDQTGHLSESLMQTQMPVVSTETCFFSDPDFYYPYISDKTYCAGFRNGSSTCNGDSGGGMVFPKTGTANPVIWQLRGVVSVAGRLSNQILDCDTSQYIVFVDVAKHLDWIKSIIQ